MVAIPTQTFYDDKTIAPTLVRFAFCKRPEVIAEAARGSRRFIRRIHSVATTVMRV